MNNQTELQAEYNLLAADFAYCYMLNRIRNLLESSFPLADHVRSDLSFLDESRQFVVDEGRQAPALVIVRDDAPIVNAECGVNQSNYNGSGLVGEDRARAAAERTDYLDVLPDCFDFVGCTV